MSSPAEPNPETEASTPPRAPRRSRLLRTPALTLEALRLVRRAAPRPLAVAVALQITAGLLLAVQLLLIKHLVSDLVRFQRDDAFDAMQLLPSFIGLITANVAGSVATAGLQQQQRLMAEFVGHYTMGGIIDVANGVGLERYEQPDFHDRLERATNAALFRPIEIVNNLTALTTALVTSAAVTIALLTLEPILVPLVLVAGLPILVATLRNSRRSYAFEHNMTPQAREHLHTMQLLTAPEYAKELRVFSAAPTIRRRHDALTAERESRLRVFLRQRLRVSVIASLGTGIGTAIALGSLFWLLATDRTAVDAAVTAALAMQLLSSRILIINVSVGKLVESGLFLEDYRSFLGELKPERGGERPLPAAGTFEDLRLEDVSFTYPGRGEPALDGVSFELRAGEVVALVGPNGSGKTTLVKLLCQLYDRPDRGRVLLNGMDLREVHPETVRRHLTVLFQDFVRYELTVADNILLGRPEAPSDDAAMRAAARGAGLDEALQRLPDGYGTRLGARFFGGTELSGGQWQRLALARAFYRGGEVLVLDEPTAALDARAEAELFERVQDLAAGKSVLLISHRLASVRRADRIYVLDGGRVVETGSHEELMRLDGLYAELFQLQAEGYLDAPSGSESR